MIIECISGHRLRQHLHTKDSQLIFYNYYLKVFMLKSCTALH